MTVCFHYKIHILELQNSTSQTRFLLTSPTHYFTTPLVSPMAHQFGSSCGTFLVLRCPNTSEPLPKVHRTGPNSLQLHVGIAPSLDFSKLGSHDPKSSSTATSAGCGIQLRMEFIELVSQRRELLGQSPG